MYNTGYVKDPEKAKKTKEQFNLKRMDKRSDRQFTKDNLWMASQ